MLNETLSVIFKQRDFSSFCQVKMWIYYFSLYLEEEQSGINTMVIYNSDKYHLATSLQIGIPQTYFSLNFARKFKEPYRKIRGSLK